MRGPDAKFFAVFGDRVAGFFAECFHFDFLFSVSVSVSLAVPRLLGEEIRIPRTDVNKKVKKYFHPIKQFFFTPAASPRSRMNARSAGGRC